MLHKFVSQMLLWGAVLRVVNTKQVLPLLIQEYRFTIKHTAFFFLSLSADVFIASSGNHCVRQL